MRNDRLPKSLGAQAGRFCLAGALLLVGCNAILGIDEARLDPDAGASDGSSEVSAPDDEGGACEGLDTSPCGQCLAQNCCDEFQACRADAECKLKLERYNGCLGTPPAADGGTGVTCNEEFGTTSGALAATFAECGIATSCFDVCQGKVIGDPCQSYCGCMQTVCCPDGANCQVKEGALADSLLSDCTTFCNGFTATQLVCRSYHCNLATRTTPEIHCEHAVGQMNTCVQ